MRLDYTFLLYQCVINGVLICPQLIPFYSIQLRALSERVFIHMARLGMNSAMTEQDAIKSVGTAGDRAIETPGARAFATEPSDSGIRSYSQAAAFTVADESCIDARNGNRTEELISAIENMLCAVRVLETTLLSSGISPRDDFETATLAYTDHLRELRDYLKQKLESQPVQPPAADIAQKRITRQVDGETMSDFRILVIVFNRHPKELQDTIYELQLTKNLQAKGVDVAPGWARGAKILVEGLSEAAFLNLPSLTLGVRHVVCTPQDEAEIMQDVMKIRNKGNSRVRPRSRSVYIVTTRVHPDHAGVQVQCIIPLSPRSDVSSDSIDKDKI